MTIDQARLILASGQGDLVTAYQVYYGPLAASGNQGNSPAAPVSPANPPAMYTPTQSSSSDPAVFSTPSYIKQLNYSLCQQQANWENTRRYDNYLNGFNNWKLNGSQGTPPAPPKYETVDSAGFDKWWALYQANPGNAAPDPGLFVTNAPGQVSP